MAENVYIVEMIVKKLKLHFLIKCDFYSDSIYHLFKKAWSIDETFIDTCMNDMEKFMY